MHSKAFNLLLTVLLALVCPRFSHALTTGAEFLRLGIGARAGSMGEAFTAVTADISSAYWNPAGLASIAKREFSFMYSDVLLDASLQFLGYAGPYKKSGTVAFSGILYSIKPIPVVIGDTQLGEASWVDASLAVSYAAKLHQNISAGASVKIISRTENDPLAGNTQGTGCAVDAGIDFTPPVKGLLLGLALLNSGPQLRMSGETKQDDLPRTARAGAAYTRRVNQACSLLVSADAQKMLSDNWHASLGAELNIRDTVFVRTGYSEKEGNISGMSVGLGFYYKNIQFDYSNAPAGQMIGYTRAGKISLTFRYY